MNGVVTAEPVEAPTRASEPPCGRSASGGSTTSAQDVAPASVAVARSVYVPPFTVSAPGTSTKIGDVVAVLETVQVELVCAATQGSSSTPAPSAVAVAELKGEMLQRRLTVSAVLKGTAEATSVRLLAGLRKTDCAMAAMLTVGCGATVGASSVTAVRAVALRTSLETVS